MPPRKSRKRSLRKNRKSPKCSRKRKRKSSSRKRSSSSRKRRRSNQKKNRKSRKRSRSRKRKRSSRRKKNKSRKRPRKLNKKSTPTRVFYTDFNQGSNLKVAIFLHDTIPFYDRVDMYTMTYNHEKSMKYKKKCDKAKYRDAWCYEHEYDFKKFKSFRFQKVLVGTDPSFGRSVDGYSLLFKTGKHTYVYAGMESYAFTVANGDSIVQLFNKIGNSHVAYPVAVGEKYVYFMLEGTYVDKQLFPPNADFLDAYGEYYYSGRMIKGLDQQAKKMKGFKRLAYYNHQKMQWYFS